jgi:hypothetical protein
MFFFSIKFLLWNNAFHLKSKICTWVKHDLLFTLLGDARRGEGSELHPTDRKHSQISFLFSALRPPTIKSRFFTSNDRIHPYMHAADQDDEAFLTESHLSPSNAPRKKGAGVRQHLATLFLSLHCRFPSLISISPSLSSYFSHQFPSLLLLSNLYFTISLFLSLSLWWNSIRDTITLDNAGWILVQQLYDERGLSQMIFIDDVDTTISVETTSPLSPTSNISEHARAVHGSRDWLCSPVSAKLFLSLSGRGWEGDE